MAIQIPAKHTKEVPAMRRYWSAFYMILAVVLIFVFGLLGGLPLTARWLLIMAVFIVLLALIGRDVTGEEREVTLPGGGTAVRFVPGRVDGVLIDLRRKVSLSRLQLVIWTVIVLSAWATLALHRTIPVLEGRLPAAGDDLAASAAKLLAGDDTPTPAQTARATAMLEQLTGAAVAPAAEGDTPPAYNPLAIDFPNELLVALGISVVSLAGAAAIKTNQAASEDGRSTQIVEERVERAASRVRGSEQQLESLESMRDNALESLSGGGLESMGGDPEAQARALREAEATISTLETRIRALETTTDRAARQLETLETVREAAVGELHTHPIVGDARWSDMLRGDTIANFQFADLGKIQMFFFTVILVFSYAALLWSIMSMPQAGQLLQIVPSLSLPAFSESLVILLGLSQAGYLTTKATA
jgi:archaellum component FlaC